MKKITPTHVDGALYVGIAVFGSLLAAVDTETAEKIFTPFPIWFWVLKTLIECGGAACGALKMYRSKDYADSVNNAPDPAISAKPPV